ncbi:MAG: Cna B-type domain-containing protein [Oscillospiraceae bacterium]|nr:Cna B-type domain-containing protein [Oscillospiraceae bacterium]
MPENEKILLEQLNRNRKDRHSLWQIVTSLSLVVILAVFWSLKLTGIGIAGEAFCGMEEHIHTEECTACTLEEHTHIESCYSNIHADIETSDDWEMTLADMVRGPTTKENVVLVAQSQLGYRESILNFQVDGNGIRRGITRYGQWYGNPYGDWSAMFVSFCLHYAGAEDAPANAGPESMRLEWEKAGLYKAYSDGAATAGNIVFLKGSEDKASAVAVVIQSTTDTVTVIEGDVDGAVVQKQYTLNSDTVLGYGLTPEALPNATLADVPAGTVPVAVTTNYSTSLITSTNQFVFYMTSGNKTYAIDGNGNAVQVYISDTGQVCTDLENPDQLLWSITSYSSNAWAIQNVATGRYLHPFYNGSSDNGITTPGRWGTTINASGTGVKFSHSAYIGQDVANGRFQMVRTQSQNVTFQVAITQNCVVWLDGTDGGLGHLTGSPDVKYTYSVGEIMQLPKEWTSPSKYSYKLRGWYDVTNARYYSPGADMVVTGNAVLYADWVASTYDIGQFNAQVANSVSTNAFMTTHMFDYNYLFNIHSVKATVTADASGHSETWSMVTSGSVAHGNQETQDFIFIDNDSGGLLCMPNNRSDHNIYPGAGIVTPGIYSEEIGRLLFATDNCYDPATGSGVVGKTYLGTGDYLFQIMDDPADEHYGYYYYDSHHNAASYNQSKGRFYVYEYLEGTSDAIGSTYSDFLPLNSPYVNTNGKTVGTYTYAGIDGEYEGFTHYRYDSKYNSGDYNSANNVQTDYAYGMRTDIKFYLPNDPGTDGNKDLYGNDMQFQFSGDDDLWVLVDGQLVLDIGGIHGAEEGVVDFSTGQVTVQGKTQTSLMDLGIGAGDHTLSILYLERGSSLSNCSIYFNLAPRFGLQLQKEDVLTQELLDGTKFTVYEDLECTKPVTLWESEEAYNQDAMDGILNEAKSTFTVTNGVAKLWGLGSGNTYYIKETGPPNKEGYGLPQGVIHLHIEKGGFSTYQADVIADADGNEPSKGFTVHGVSIDDETKTVYMVVTNAPETVVDTTTVQVIKKWKDTTDHSKDYIKAYLTVTDPDGTIRRIREVTLSDENEWSYIWTNLPEYDYDTMTKVKYGVEESYESGYYSTVRQVTQIQKDKTEWAEAASFVNGESYILQTANGFLSTTSTSDAKLKWVDKATAQSSSLALWTTKVSSGKVTFTNAAGQTLSFNYSSWSSSSRYFYATSGSATYQSFGTSQTNAGFRLYVTRSGTNYYIANSNINSNGRLSATTSSSSAMVFTPFEQTTTTQFHPVEDWAYEITNTPLPRSNETSFAVKKNWSVPVGYDSKVYEEFTVTVRLLANGVETGRSITLSLKNGWEGKFLGLPYADEDGNVIQYSVVENWKREYWSTTYGEVVVHNGDPPTYSLSITNEYIPGGPMLPSTGSAARLMFVLCGAAIMLASLVYGFLDRRKRERRTDTS